MALRFGGGMCLTNTVDLIDFDKADPQKLDALKQKLEARKEALKERVAELDEGLRKLEQKSKK